MSTPRAQFSFDTQIAGAKDVNFSFEEDLQGFPRHDGGGCGLPVINTARAKMLGLRKESDWKVFSWWRVAINNNPKIFATFYESRLKELSLTEFNRTKKAPGTPDLTLQNITAARETLELIINADRSASPNASNEHMQELFDKVYNDPNIRAFITISLNYQHGREIKGLNKYLNQIRLTGIADPTWISKESFQDLLGEYRLEEALYTLKAAEFFDGVSLKTTDANNFAIVLNRPGQDPLELVKSSITEITDATGKIKSLQTSYTIGPNVTGAELDRAIKTMAEAIASHRQVCNKDSGNIAKVAGMKSPMQLMRLVEELICEHHMHVDLSAVSAKMDQALIDGNYPQDVKDRWELLKKLSKVYSASSRDKFFAPLDKTLFEPSDQANFLFGNGAYDKDLMKDEIGNHHELTKWLRANVLEKDVYNPGPAAAVRPRVGSL